MVEVMKARARAVVTVKLRVETSAVWGNEASVAEVMRVGERETVNALRKALSDGKLKHEMLGEPEVGFVVWDKVEAL